MADNDTKRTKRKHEQTKIYGRVVQVAAILAVIVMIFIDFSNESEKISDWVYGVMLGIAAGANPDDLARVFGARK